MEYISKKLTYYILKKGMITEELTEVYEYGFQCFLEFSLSTLCSIIIAIFLNMLPECLFFFLIFIPMRSFGGGVHMKTYLACFIGSCLLLTSTMLAVKYLSVPIYFSLGLYIISAILVMIIGPVNHPNREVDCQENHTFMRKTYLTLLLSLICAVFFIYIKSTRYMFLQALVFFIIFVTSLIGRLLYKD